VNSRKCDRGQENNVLSNGKVVRKRKREIKKGNRNHSLPLLYFKKKQNDYDIKTYNQSTNTKIIKNE
jgi:hypothetical protein